MNKNIHYIYIIAVLLLMGVASTLQAQTIKGNIYGGGALSQVDGNTNVLLNTGKVEKDVFGGGMGKLNDDHTVNMSADVTGNTTVTANGTTFAFPEEGIDENVNHNIYGGGNLACKVNASNVNVYAGLMAAGFMDDDADTTPWGKWIGQVKAQDDNVVQGSVFGGGYGVNTVVETTATVNVAIPTGDDTPDNRAMVDVVGGGYNGYVLNNTSVTVEGAAEIYKIYGGGLGSHGGYEDAPATVRSHANLTDYTMQQTIGAVGENKEGDGTSLLIKGGKFYNDIFGGGAGLKYSNDGAVSYMNVAEVFGTTSVTIDAIDGWKDEEHAFSQKIYGGGALGMVNQPISVEVKSGWIIGGEVFAGSLGEMWHLDKARVANGASVKTIANDSEPAGELRGLFNIYGGCDMAQLTGNTDVKVLYGRFSGNIFGGGKGVEEADGTEAGKEQFVDYGKVIGNTNIVLDAPDIVLGEDDETDSDGNIIKRPKIGIYGGGALGLVEGTINPVTLKSGTLYGSIFGGSLGEKGHLAKALVKGETAVITEASTINVTDGVPAALNGKFNIYGGCDMAQVKGNTDVTIQHGTFTGEIYGGGKGLASVGEEDYMDYGCVFGTTNVLYDNDNEVEGQGTFDGDIYGGGALGLVRDPLEEDKPADWIKPDYITEVHLKKGDLNGRVFGGGFGEKVNEDKAKVSGNTLVATDKPDADTDKLGGDINHVFGGGNMAQVYGDTRVEITHGSFSGTIFGGGNGIEEEEGTPAGSEQYMDFGKVTGETFVLIDGPDLKLGKATYFTADEATAYNTANDLHDGDPDFKHEGDWKEILSTMSIYGGGALGMVGKSITVEVKSGEIYGSVFAGSKGEKGHVNKALVTTEGEKKVSVKTMGSKTNFLADGTTPADLIGDFKIYGGCDLAMFEGISEVVINHGNFSGEIYGGGNGLSSADDGGEPRYGQVTGSAKVIYDSDGTFNGDIYGGGALGLVVPNGFDKDSYAVPDLDAPAITTVYLSKGEVNGNVFGGSLGEKIAQEKAMVYGNTLVTTDTGAAGSIGGRIENFFGGGNMASVNGNTQVHVNRGHFNGRIFGGGNGVPSEGENEYLEFGKVLGSSTVLIDGDETLQLGEQDQYTAADATTHNTALHATPGDVDYVQEGDYKKPMKIYGGGALGKVAGTINIAIKNGEHYGEVFGGSLGEKGHPDKALVTGNTNALAVANKLVDDDPTKPADDATPLTGDLKFYGGCEMARVEGQSKVTINHGTFTGAIYGGGKGIPTYEGETYMEYGKVVGKAAAGADPADPVIASVVEFDNDKGTFTGNIYGGGALGKIESGLANVQMVKGTVNGNIYGGSYGENGLPEKGTAAATLVEMLGGSVNAVVDTELKGEVYGGGALANIADSTEVRLFGGTVWGNVFGGGLGNATTYQEVGGNTKVILGTEDYSTASVIESSIFGANNINGTPRGRSFVHVRRTIPRSRNKDLAEKSVPEYEDSYDVLAVYGGGNLSAYQPSDATYAADKGFATVLVENCDNSIAYVYGGGNAAPVPGTDVKIYGADAIDHAFAGGNGKGTGNKGADVGFLDFYSVKKNEATKYGSGKAQIAVYGGTVHNVYGGSNTLGYIRTSSSVSVADPEPVDPYNHGCQLNVGKTFGGGNEADIVGSIDMRLECTAGADIVFAGANNANVFGDIHLTVNSGTYRQLFCSNNQGGAVFGKLQLDVEETGCTPIIVKELFGGGNLAAYSVYGYKKNAEDKYEPLESMTEFNALTADEKREQRFVEGKPYADPVVNIYSCTAIGTVYGGGFGNLAVVYGNPTVNVDMVKGAFAGKTLNHENYENPILVIADGVLGVASSISIPDTLGIIGNIFGGGKEADVYGNTTVNVCVNHPERSALISPFVSEAMAKIMSFSAADITAHDVPTGSVYGGGKMANVWGNTKVHIRNGNIEGNVFGAGQGDASLPDAALVKGKTEVIIGE